MKHIQFSSLVFIFVSVSNGSLGRAASFSFSGDRAAPWDKISPSSEVSTLAVLKASLGESPVLEKRNGNDKWDGGESNLAYSERL